MTLTGSLTIAVTRLQVYFALYNRTGNSLQKYCKKRIESMKQHPCIVGNIHIEKELTEEFLGLSRWHLLPQGDRMPANLH